MGHRMTQFVLYSTLGCHLCENAKQMLEMLTAERSIDWSEADIALEDSLIERYGVRIPVLRHCSSGREIGWPFDAAALTAWLEDTAKASECG